MGNFFKSLFSSSKTEEAPDTISKTAKKNFDIFKYDGIRAQRMGQIPYAIKCFTEALNIQKDFEVMTYLVTAYVNSHEFEDALEVTNWMVEFEPDDAIAYLSRVNVLLLMDKGEEALQDCRRALELDEANHVTWFLMGKAKRAVKDIDGAIESLAKAIAIKEDFTEAYLLRSEILLEANQPQEALPDIEKVIELAPEEENAYLIKGQIHEKLGDFATAADDYNQVLELNPFNTDASVLFGDLLINTGKIDDAIELFNELIELKPDFAKAYHERAKAKELKGDTAGAAEDLKTANELSLEGDTSASQSNFSDMYKGGIY